MKKLLAVFAINASLFTTSFSVVSCAKEPKNVIFTVDASVATSKSIQNAYKDLVTEFNKENSNSDIQVQLNIAPAGAILNAIYSSEYLPDLYLTYPDNVTRYLDVIPDDVVELTSDYYSESGFNPKVDSFLEEGQIHGKQYVLPMSKSFDVTNVNLRILRELTTIVEEQDPSSTFWSTEWDYKSDNDMTAKDVKASTLYKGSNLKADALSDGIEQQAKTLFDSISQVSDADSLRTILQKDDNDVILAHVMWNLKNDINTDILQSTDKVFTMGIDDLPNKIYSQYGENILSGQNATTQIKTLSENNKFLYNYIGTQFEINDVNGMSGINDQLDFLSQLQKIKGKDKSLITADVSKNEKADLLYAYNIASTGNKIYSSNYFAEGTMLMASGSSAGSFYYATGYNKHLDPGLTVKNTDILTVGTPTKMGSSYIVQQGPGIAAFKSSNSAKTVVVKKFVNFLMNEENQAAFAIKTGYMPSNNNAYEKTDYSKWISGEKKPIINGKASSRQNLILKQLTHMLDTADEGKNHFVTIEGSPMGTSIREKVILTQIQSTMLRYANQDLSFVQPKSTNKSKEFWNNVSPTLESIYTDLIPEGSVKYESNQNDLNLKIKTGFTRRKI